MSAIDSSSELQALLGGKYRVSKVLGRGGMGVVVEAQSTATKGVVAIKIIQRIEADGGAEALVRFEREVRAAGSVSSPHVVRIFDTGVVEGSPLPYLVMERLQGEDLAALLRRLGPLEPAAATRVAAQMLRGLVAVHEAGIVHRDIKPGNVFLTDVGLGEVVIKLVDFGVAKLTVDTLAEGEAAVSRTGCLLGSPEYMSPEQAMGERTIDVRTDVFSTGVVLYKMLTGESPHSGLSLAQTLMAVCSRSPADVRTAAPWVSSELATIVAKATAMRREDRYESARAMLQALLELTSGAHQLATGDSISASPTTRSHVPAPGASSRTLGGTADTLAKLASSERPSSKARAAVAALVALLAIAAVFFVLARRNRPDARPEATRVATSASSEAAVAQDLEVVVQIAPPEARATLDGSPISARGGFVSVKGPIGSEHVLTLDDADGKSTAFKVRVTREGALPGQIALASPSAPPATATAKAVVSGPKSSGTRPRSSAPTSAPSPKGVGIAKDFDN